MTLNLAENSDVTFLSIYLSVCLFIYHLTVCRDVIQGERQGHMTLESNRFSAANLPAIWNVDCWWLHEGRCLMHDALQTQSKVTRSRPSDPLGTKAHGTQPKFSAQVLVPESRTRNLGLRDSHARLVLVIEFCLHFVQIHLYVTLQTNKPYNCLRRKCEKFNVNSCSINTNQYTHDFINESNVFSCGAKYFKLLFRLF